MNFLDGSSKNTQLLKLMKIRPLVAEFIYADLRSDRFDEAYSRLWQFCERHRACRSVSAAALTSITAGRV
jgi:hypothetical protein